ncbi:MAG: transcription antitermination factor NusB [bacterium]|nr:transcription antitermination factor NusB [bacterium]
MLFQLDLTEGEPAEVFSDFWTGQQATPDARAFAERLVLGVFGQRGTLDSRISDAAEHWRVDRMAVVDRNVLRMAIYEMLHDEETPEVVVIDEAIEVAKKFGGAESGKFVNGILDSVRRRLESGELRRPDDGGPA